MFLEHSLSYMESGDFTADIRRTILSEKGNDDNDFKLAMYCIGLHISELWF